LSKKEELKPRFKKGLTNNSQPIPLTPKIPNKRGKKEELNWG